VLSFSRQIVNNSCDEAIEKIPTIKTATSIGYRLGCDVFFGDIMIDFVAIKEILSQYSKNGSFLEKYDFSSSLNVPISFVSLPALEVFYIVYKRNPRRKIRSSGKWMHAQEFQELLEKFAIADQSNLRKNFEKIQFIDDVNYRSLLLFGEQIVSFSSSEVLSQHTQSHLSNILS
jgi:hypothetical protein